MEIISSDFVMFLVLPLFEGTVGIRVIWGHVRFWMDYELIRTFILSENGIATLLNR